MADLGRSWFYFTQIEKRSLRFVTVIIGAVRLRESDLEDPALVEKIVISVDDMFEQFRRDWTGLTRGRHLKGYTWRGEFELDLRRGDLGEHCRATLAAVECDVSPLAKDERVLIVHVHLVLEASKVIGPEDVTGDGWADKVREHLRGAWPGSRRTQVKGLYEGQTVRMAVKKIHGYVRKREMCYSTGGFNDEPTKFEEPYEIVWERLVKCCYNGLVKGSEFRSRL